MRFQFRDVHLSIAITLVLLCTEDNTEFFHAVEKHDMIGMVKKARQMVGEDRILNAFTNAFNYGWGSGNTMLANDPLTIDEMKADIRLQSFFVAYLLSWLKSGMLVSWTYGKSKTDAKFFDALPWVGKEMLVAEELIRADIEWIQNHAGAEPTHELFDSDLEFGEITEERELAAEMGGNDSDASFS